MDDFAIVAVFDGGHELDEESVRLALGEATRRLGLPEVIQLASFQLLLHRDN